MSCLSGSLMTATWSDITWLLPEFLCLVAFLFGFVVVNKSLYHVLENGSCCLGCHGVALQSG